MVYLKLKVEVTIRDGLRRTGQSHPDDPVQQLVHGLDAHVGVHLKEARHGGHVRPGTPDRHSCIEPVKPFRHSGVDEGRLQRIAIQREILRRKKYLAEELVFDEGDVFSPGR